MRSLTVVPLQRRLTAVALSAALAVGAVFPPVSFALVTEGDQEQEGTADPGAQAPDSTADPDFDPGGEDALPFDVGALADDGDTGAPVEAEPVQDPDALAALPDEPEDDPASDVAAPPLGDAEPAPPPAPAPAPIAAPPAVEATPPAAEPTTEPPAGRDRTATKRERDRAERRAKRTPPAPRPVVTIPAPAPQPAPVPVTAPTAPATVTTAAETTAPSVARGSRTYTVRSGDCLWTIAVALLGDELDGLTEADRNARIQARVDRLYTLNQDRIGPNPSVLNEGTVLRLR